MGYTPVFSDIYMGTLYGRWPAAAVWASLLPLLDKNGVIDMSMQAISGMTGWPLDLLEKGISQLSEPDPGSRSSDSDGRRLVSLEDGRPWGWQAVNHTKYREKARLMAKNAREVESGVNRDRLLDRRSPPTTAADPLSNTNTDIYKNKEKRGEEARKAIPAHRLPEDFSLTDERKKIATAEGLDAERVFADFRDYWTAASGAKARKCDWDATWRIWCRNQFSKKPTRGAYQEPKTTWRPPPDDDEVKRA